MAVRAPSFTQDLEWLQSPPLALSELKGRWVLLEFFTFGCINCINNIETIKKLHLAYQDSLTVIGVHTGKFDYEKETSAIQTALHRFNIPYPVINDPLHTLATAYTVKGWPGTILIDPNGYIVEHLSGEQDLETWSTLLQDYGVTPKEREEIPAVNRHTLSFPQKVLATQEYLFVANTAAHEVWRCDYAGKVLEIISADSPMGMAYTPEGLYICESRRGVLSFYDFKTQTKHLLLENLRNPYDVTFSKECLTVALAGSHQLKQYHPQSLKLLQTFGNRFEALRDGDAESCQLAQPSALTKLDETLFFLDAESSSLRALENGVVTTLSGEGLFSFGDTQENGEQFQHPQGLCGGIIGDGCGGGRLFIADTFNHKIKVYYPEEHSLMTLMENLQAPADVTKKGCKLYIANTNAHEILEYDLSSMQATVMQFTFKAS